MSQMKEVIIQVLSSPLSWFRNFNLVPIFWENCQILFETSSLCL